MENYFKCHQDPSFKRQLVPSEGPTDVPAAASSTGDSAMSPPRNSPLEVAPALTAVPAAANSTTDSAMSPPLGSAMSLPLGSRRAWDWKYYRWEDFVEWYGEDFAVDAWEAAGPLVAENGTQTDPPVQAQPVQAPPQPQPVQQAALVGKKRAYNEAILNSSESSQALKRPARSR